MEELALLIDFLLLKRDCRGPTLEGSIGFAVNEHLPFTTPAPRPCRQFRLVMAHLTDDQERGHEEKRGGYNA